MSEVLEKPKLVDPNSLAGRPNLNQTPLGPSGIWTLEKILALNGDEGIALWGTLPAPTLEEMNGHYMGLGANGLDVERQAGFANNMLNEHSRLGYWLGKAFRPTSATAGEGYNRWRFPGGEIVHNQRMITRVQNSIIDGKPVYAIDYPSVNPKTTLFDELRRLDDGVYIGTATTATADGGRTPMGMFLLVGPTDRWVGGPFGPDMRPA